MHFYLVVCRKYANFTITNKEIKDMTLFKLITKGRTFSFDEVMTIYNAYREWVGAIGEEAIYDLHDDEDGMLWVEMYGLTDYRKSVAKARYWVGGADYTPVRTYPVTESNYMGFLRTACDESEECITEYFKNNIDGVSFDYLIRVCNNIFEGTIDVSEWCYANIPSKVHVHKYGQEWRIYPKSVQPNTKWANNPEGTDDWLVLQLPTGGLWMNNNHGYVMITEEGQTLYRDF